MQQLAILFRLVLQNARDLLPIVLVVAFFQGAVLRQPMPDLGSKLLGAVLILVGLTLFVRGLSMSLFPLGESLAGAFARRGNLALLLVFAFALGFGSTVAEPALFAVVSQAAETASTAGLIGDAPGQADRYALTLRYVASAAVGVAVALGCWRIIMGWPVAWFVLGGYGLASVVALAGSTPLLGVALDAGAAATSAINVPLIVALGTGLATMLRNRSPLVDGFGLVALASLMPLLSILLGSLVLL
jgi:Protein of unknown function (DUF1538)